MTNFGPKSPAADDDSSSMTLAAVAVEPVDCDDSVYSCSSSGYDYDDDDTSPQEDGHDDSEIATLEQQLAKVKNELETLQRHERCNVKEEGAGAAAGGVVALQQCKAEPQEQPPQPKRFPRPRGSVAVAASKIECATDDPYL